MWLKFCSSFLFFFLNQSSQFVKSYGGVDVTFFLPIFSHLSLCSIETCIIARTQLTRQVWRNNKRRAEETERRRVARESWRRARARARAHESEYGMPNFRAKSRSRGELEKVCAVCCFCCCCCCCRCCCRCCCCFCCCFFFGYSGFSIQLERYSQLTNKQKTFTFLDKSFDQIHTNKR